MKARCRLGFGGVNPKGDPLIWQAVLVLALSLPGAGFGDSMRCQNSGGSSLVSTGDSKFRVLEACGE
ncbi:MAG: DUF2845 domain-containing protein, partial [Magnetococcales bacterium]|nr:DUF2845 domain-containing protein [Magnetococcales bacterium]